MVWLRFEEITSVASEHQIIEVIGAAARLRDDMFDLKREVEDALRRMAIFAAVHCSFGDNRILWVHGSRERTRGSERATVASSSASEQ
jgi:hypothetical protein